MKRVRGLSDWSACGLALLVVVSTAAPAAQTTAGSEGRERCAILIGGISGDPALRDEYLGQIMELRSILIESLGFEETNVLVLFEDPALAPGKIQYRSTRDGLEKACGQLAGRIARAELVFVFVAGHGSYDKSGYKLNLVGPDPTGDDLAGILYSIPAERTIVVNTTSASGGSIPALAQKGKIVIAATKSGNERNRTRMGAYFIESLKGNAADLDKNGRVSVLEAFSFAVKRVEEYHSREGSLQTEHPVLEDNGDGEAYPDPGPQNGEGLLARTTYLGAASPTPAGLAQSAEQQALAREIAALEKAVEKLRYEKSSMPAEEYEKKLEALLIRLAELNAKRSQK